MSLSIIALAFLLAILLSSIPDILFAHTAESQLAVDMQPVFSDPHNPVTKAYFVMDGQPSAHLYNSIRLTNIGTTRGTVSLYPADAFTMATGGLSFSNWNDARRDVGAWIQLSRRQVILSPGESQDVPFQVIIPPHVRPGQHVGGIVAENVVPQTFASHDKKQQVPINLQQRRVLAVQVNLPGPPLEKVIGSGIHYDKANRYQRLLIDLHNTGNMMVHPSGTLQIFDANGHRIQNLNLRIQTFLPQTSIAYPVYILRKVLPIGRYSASLALTYEHKQKLVYTATFTIEAEKKTPSNAIAALVALGESSNVFHLLSPWQLIVGGGAVLLVVLRLGSWLYKMLKSVARSVGKKEEQEVGIYAHAKKESFHDSD
jgi:hypothetical protein